MNDWILNLISRYRRHGVLIDTNVLLLYFVGSFDRGQITRFKGTSDRFVPEDYDTLCAFVRQFQRQVTTPNILSEVNSLSGQLGEPERTSYFERFARGITLFDEHYVASREVAGATEFVKVGLTDAGIFHLAKARFLVLTDDFRLSQCLQSADIDAINFNHIRPLRWE